MGGVVRFTLDEQPALARAGETIWQVAQRHGIRPRREAPATRGQGLEIAQNNAGEFHRSLRFALASGNFPWDLRRDVQRTWRLPEGAARNSLEYKRF